MMQRKVVVGAIAGAITTIAAWMAHEFAGVDIPVEIAQSITVVVSALVSWVTPDALEE